MLKNRNINMLSEWFQDHMIIHTADWLLDIAEKQLRRGSFVLLALSLKLTEGRPST